MRQRIQGWGLAAVGLLACDAHALELETGNPDFQLRWDNTVKYSAAFRLGKRSDGLALTSPGGVNNVNQDDGDNNFSRGLVSNRLDILSELDARYTSHFGARVSAAAWYDSVYNDKTDNAQPATANHSPASRFPGATRREMGRDGELLDAFVYGKFDVGDKPASVRLGRYSLLWGESLFYGVNGIAGEQAPVDLVKLVSVPNSQFKETVRPTGKLSGQVQLSADVSVGAYWNYEWESTRMLPVGSYLSAADIVGPGAEEILTGGPSFLRTHDLKPKDRRQGGLQLRWRAADTDFGLYATRSHATTFSNVYLLLDPGPTSFAEVYHEGIGSYGFSASRAIGDWSLAAETSYRVNTPLASAPEPVTLAQISGSDPTRAYAVGQSVHAQVSWLASLGPSWIASEASFLGEVAWNARTRFTSGREFANPNADRSATSIRMAYSPTYRQVVDGLDLTPTLGGSYTHGRSSAVGPGFGVDKGGDLNVGLSGLYLDRWTVAMNLVHYYGPEGGTTDNAGLAQYKQALKDRDFVSLSVRTTF